MAVTSNDELLIKIEGMAAAISQASDSAKATLQRQYLELIGHFLADQGRGEAIAFPLLDLIEHFDQGLDGQASKMVERRTGVVDCSDELLAKVSAVVDVLISAGYSSDNACQIVTRQMIARGLQLPAGGDARAWRNMQAWRHKLINSKHEGLAWRTYVAFKDELPAIYGTRLAEAAAREAIWDRRAKRAAAPAGA
ncbi:MAG: hypothetical protein Q7T86_11175 [Hyphomicrobiaceae bacterium]|nr:hypothetical protein [Hyphomicrobiaceae bacterium]